MKALAQKHGPTVGIVTAGLIAFQLMQPATSPQAASPTLGAGIHTEPVPGKVDDWIVTRLVSCGSKPLLVGNDQAGTVTVGEGAHGCTVLFAKADSHSCTIIGGTATKLSATDLVVTGVADAFRYDCK